MAIKTAKELAAACKDVALNHKTLYVMGCFGAPMNEKNKKRYTTNHSYNKKSSRTKKINAASADTFGFDCVCLIKGLLWGWDGDTTKVYGGSVYKSNDVPDIGANSIIKKCSGISTDFSKIQIGELLWKEGHVGIYIGDGFGVECTPAWEDKVQITAVKNIGTKAGYEAREWTKHGKLPYVSYDAAETEEKVVSDTTKKELAISMRTLKKGAEGEDVRALQILLKGRGCNGDMHAPDGLFGPNTLGAVKLYQNKVGLEDDGVVGKLTWSKLLGLE